MPQFATPNRSLGNLGNWPIAAFGGIGLTDRFHDTPVCGTREGECQLCGSAIASLSDRFGSIV